jgi:2-isopropylmalate synthase
VGEDAQGEARVEIECNGRIQRGQAVSTDIIEASALAFLQAINRLSTRKQQPRLNPQTEEVTAT